MTTAETRLTLSHQADSVWRIIRGFDNMDRYLSAVSQCRVEGQGEGAIRYCTLGDDVVLKEKIIHLDDDKRSLQYQILQGEVPFQNYRGRCTVAEINEQSCEVHWLGEFDVQGMEEQDVINMLKGFYQEALENIAKELSQEQHHA